MDVNNYFNRYFYYDETSPSCLRWALDRGICKSVVNVHKGDIAGTIKNDAVRWKVRLNGKTYYVYRVIWQMFHGEIPTGMFIDHIDRDKTNNNISNLRLVTREVNARNCKKKTNNATGFTGVSRCSKVWDDPIYHYGKYYDYYFATWVDFNGKKHAKYFSVEKFGEEEAFRLACEYRAKMVAQLNAQGAGYTTNHGKD